MSSAVTKGYLPSNAQPLVQNPRPNPSKIERVWTIIRECVIKEFGSCLRHVWNRVVFCIKPHIYELNPVTIESTKKADQIAKVVLLMHGMGAHHSCFIPLAKKFHDNSIKNIFTVSLKQTDVDPVPIGTLAKRVDEITQTYLAKGFQKVEYSLVGHSLGALAASKYIWRGNNNVENSEVSMMISIAGRLNFVENDSSWFCGDDVKSEIDETFKELISNLDKVKLYTIGGDKDAIVPQESIHIQKDESRELTVKGWGHGGIVYAPETHDKVISLTEKWLLA